MSKSILEQYYTVLSTDSILLDLLGGDSNNTRIFPEFPDLADNNPAITYSEAVNEARSTPQKSYDLTLQFTVFAKTQDLVEDIADRIDFLLNYYKRSAITPLILWSRRTLRVDNPETDRNMKRKDLRYRIWVAKDN